MRVRSNSKHSNSGMDVEKPKLKEETHLSGAYIRSLVKQLSSSSRPKDLSNPKPANSSAAEDGRCRDECHGELAPAQQQQEALAHASQAPPHKKQVRRRLHTSKPYQERLLNMAEARREIVTALKFHRASMKQAKEQQQQQQQQSHNSQIALSPCPPSSLDQEMSHELMDPKTNSRACPLNYTFPGYFNGSPFSPLSCSSPFSYRHPSNITTTTPVMPLPDNFKIPFPNQPLGLNLNLQGFHDIEASFHAKPQLMEPLPSPSSSSSYSYSSPITTTSNMDVGVVPSIVNHPDQASRMALEYPSAMSLHPVMDDAEMAEIRSIGEQHDMEWNDTVNLVTSAWWSKFLKDMEDNKDGKEGGGHGYGDKLSHSHVFGEVFDMQSCVSDGGGGRDGNEGSFFQQQLGSYYHAPEYQQDDALACLDIGELERWEWLT